MKKEIIQKLHTSFEDVAHDQDGVEFWLARDLQVLLGYDEWRNFTKVIEKAQESCVNGSSNRPNDAHVLPYIECECAAATTSGRAK